MAFMARFRQRDPATPMGGFRRPSRRLTGEQAMDSIDNRGTVMATDVARGFPSTTDDEWYQCKSTS